MQSCITPVLLAAALLSASVGALAKEGGDQSPNGAGSYLAGALPPAGTYLLNYFGHYGGKLQDTAPGQGFRFVEDADAADASGSETAESESTVSTETARMEALRTLRSKLEEYGLSQDVTRLEVADTEQLAFLYQDRISVLLGTLNDLDYKLDRARYVLTNADGKGCAPTDTGRLDFSHVSAGSTRKIYFAQGQPTLPSGYVVPEKTVPEEPDTSAAEDTAADGAEDAAAAQPADDTAAAAEETPLTDPARMTANNEENPM